MKRGELKRNSRKGIWCWLLLIGLALLAGIVTSDDTAAASTMDYERISDAGFGDPQNNYAWSVAEFKGDIYVGTGLYSP